MKRRSAGGSSPLARGLRPNHNVTRLTLGIIPARAGFTLSSRPLRTRAWDHPRSRGVYVLLSGRSGSGVGSSPLARGLLLFSLPVWVRIGIIPARAGFTAFEASADGKGTDHPRSRGVYAEQSVVPPCQMGSSPLARGLPDATAATPRTTGIIPARAGFTRTSRCEGRRRRDHPRSRGVYASSAERRPFCRGSSPLARGLPRAHAPPPAGDGIIPARAGFTLSRRNSHRSPLDHPRSRGVYLNPSERKL